MVYSWRTGPKLARPHLGFLLLPGMAGLRPDFYGLLYFTYGLLCWSDEGDAEFIPDLPEWPADVVSLCLDF